MKDIYFTKDESTIVISREESEKLYKALDENNTGMQHAAIQFLISLAVYIKNNNMKERTIVIDLKPHQVIYVSLAAASYHECLHGQELILESEIIEDYEEAGDIAKILEELYIFVPIWNSDYTDTKGISCINFDGINY